jgi:hypothetical protein
MYMNGTWILEVRETFFMHMDDELLNSLSGYVNFAAFNDPSDCLPHWFINITRKHSAHPFQGTHHWKKSS